MRTKPAEQQKWEIAWRVEHDGAEVEEYKGFKILTYWSEIRGVRRPCLRVYRGNSSKAIAGYYYHSEEARDNAAQEYRGWADREEKAKEERKAAKAAVSNENIEVGSIWYSSWGYEQTNIDFYEVVGKFGKKGLIFREVYQNREVDGYESGTCVPRPGDYKGEEFRKQINSESWISLNSFSGMSPWGGNPKRWTSYY
jgi:hypothetical protein